MRRKDKSIANAPQKQNVERMHWINDAAFLELKRRINAADEATGRVEFRFDAPEKGIRVCDGVAAVEGVHALDALTDIDTVHVCPLDCP